MVGGAFWAFKRISRRVSLLGFNSLGPFSHEQYIVNACFLGGSAGARQCVHRRLSALPVDHPTHGGALGWQLCLSSRSNRSSGAARGFTWARIPSPSRVLSKHMRVSTIRHGMETRLIQCHHLQGRMSRQKSRNHLMMILTMAARKMTRSIRSVSSWAMGSSGPFVTLRPPPTGARKANQFQQKSSWNDYSVIFQD